MPHTNILANLANQTSFSFQSPAKINLYLHIIGQKTDGYHLLQSTFCLINLEDTLTFNFELNFDKINNFEAIEQNYSLTHKIQLFGCEGINLQDNLIYKAANLLLTQSQHEEKFNKATLANLKNYQLNIKVNKKIPMGAGLGGASSNAATTLIALNQLLQLNYSNHQLADIAVNLGADVPFFIHQHPINVQASGFAFIEGIGEQVHNLTNADLTQFNLQKFKQATAILIKPPIHSATASLFKSALLERNYTPIHINQQLQAINTGHNSMQQAFIETYEPMHEFFKLMQQYLPILNWRMTGSGSCFFTLLPNSNSINPQQALQKLQQLQVNYSWFNAWQIWPIYLGAKL